MAELNEIMSDKKAGTYKKDFFNVASYIEKFYDAEEYLFNFEANIYLSEYELYDTPDNCHFKSFMDYRTITDKTSKQFDMQNNEAYTDVNTGLRMVNDRYCIAVGSFYTKTIGKKIDVVLENGTIIPCIFAEAKSDEHTDKLTHRQNPNGSVIEFIVDTPLLDNKVIHSGNIEFVNDFLDNLTLGMDNKDEEKGLVISTVHSAKGLEWEYVFVLDCVTGVYPGFNAMSMAEEERQENLRVFYVAITRAKKQMYLCVPEIYHERKVYLTPYLKHLNNHMSFSNNR